MIDSPAKRLDIETRLQVLELLSVVVRVYSATKYEKYLEVAKELGEQSARLKEKIETHNYEEDDRKEAHRQDMDRRWEGLK